MLTPDMTEEEKAARRKAIGWPHGCACGERFTTADQLAEHCETVIEQALSEYERQLRDEDHAEMLQTRGDEFAWRAR